jgi:putative endonuclease
MWFCYILECSDGTLYTGITNDLGKRVHKHNSGKGAKYTKTRLPAILKWSVQCSNKSEASKLEWKIKKLPRSKKLILFSEDN